MLNDKQLGMMHTSLVELTRNNDSDARIALDILYEHTFNRYLNLFAQRRVWPSPGLDVEIERTARDLEGLQETGLMIIDASNSILYDDQITREGQ